MNGNPIEIMKKSEFIPIVLIDFTKRCINCNITNSLMKSLEWDAEKTVFSVSEMFRMAAGYTGEKIDLLLSKTGFKNSDMNPERLDSAFAELRAINFLGLNGFKCIQIIHSKEKKYADLIALRNGMKICFEVMCITNASKEKWEHKDITKYIDYRLNSKGKLEQLENTRIDLNCDFMNFLVVIVNDAGKALNDRNDYINILKDLYEVNQKSFLSFSILTGMKDGFTGIADECFYPELF